MAFKLKSHSDVFGIHEKTSQFGTPVIVKDDLESGVQAEANRDGTICVSDKLSDKQIEGAVEHEKIHLDQIAQGRFLYSEEIKFCGMTTINEIIIVENSIFLSVSNFLIE